MSCGDISASLRAAQLAGAFCPWCAGDCSKLRVFGATLNPVVSIASIKATKPTCQPVGRSESVEPLGLSDWWKMFLKGEKQATCSWQITSVTGVMLGRDVQNPRWGYHCDCCDPPAGSTADPTNRSNKFLARHFLCPPKTAWLLTR